MTIDDKIGAVSVDAVWVSDKLSEYGFTVEQLHLHPRPQIVVDFELGHEIALPRIRLRRSAIWRLRSGVSGSPETSVKTCPLDRSRKLSVSGALRSTAVSSASQSIDMGVWLMALAACAAPLKSLTVVCRCGHCKEP